MCHLRYSDFMISSSDELITAKNQDQFSYNVLITKNEFEYEL